MKSATPQLIALLAAGPWGEFELWTITLLNGTVFRWTSYGQDLVVGGNTYQSSGSGVPIVEAGVCSSVEGLQTGSLEITIKVAPSVLFGGIPFPLAAAHGLFDGARVQMDLIFMAFPGDTSIAPLLKEFYGYVASPKPSSTQVTLTCKTELDRLNILLPRNTFQSGCTHALFDIGCTLNPATYVRTMTVSSVSGGNIIFSSSTAFTGFATGDYDLGYLTFTSGLNTGETATIQSSTLAGIWTFNLVTNLPAAAQTGDTFQLFPGCDRLLTTCANKYANQANYRGFTSVPPPTQIL